MTSGWKPRLPLCAGLRLRPGPLSSRIFQCWFGTNIIIRTARRPQSDAGGLTIHSFFFPLTPLLFAFSSTIAPAFFCLLLPRPRVVIQFFKLLPLTHQVRHRLWQSFMFSPSVRILQHFQSFAIQICHSMFILHTHDVVEWVIIFFKKVLITSNRHGSNLGRGFRCVSINLQPQLRGGRSNWIVNEFQTADISSTTQTQIRNSNLPGSHVGQNISTQVQVTRVWGKTIPCTCLTISDNSKLKCSPTVQRRKRKCPLLDSNVV